PLAEKILFSPTRAKEELYELATDPHQIRDLAGDPAFASVLEDHRRRLDAKLSATRDPGPESMAMYDSDMKPYLSKGNPEVERNIAQMKKWAAEGK
ncbi:MAG: sulfatase, partial [Opitutales bacterium]